MEKPPKTRKNIFLRIILCALACYAVYTLVDMQVTLSEKRQELLILQDQYEKQRLDNKDLQGKLARGVGDEDIERIAREKLEYVAPDEQVFIDISGS